MKKFFKIFGIIILLIITTLVIVGWSISEDLPEGKSGANADQLAEKILESINHDAYQNTSIISWNFADLHDYEWHKNENYVIVDFDENKVQLNLKDYAKSKVLEPQSISEENQKKLIDETVKYFNNDSFWLVAPHMIMDKNVERKIVKHDGKNALLVTFKKGGTTPGDSYLWIVDENYRPKAFKMWVSIIPIGGLKAEWKDWELTNTGVMMSTKKTIFSFPIEIKNLSTVN
ncbi:hypothetical protein [Psychroflexus aestuariivivens]|uniref:hypothetical protein n=1 Tax=Psychroflexus aestuariivivens TaxID=1795040 RepID=UPI000FD6EB1C|nr:hypothetical protein [Psychroflexus aestuariivivens]